MKRQGGAAVLATVLVIVLLAITMRLYAEHASAQKIRYQVSHRDNLAYARDALIDYAVNYPSHYADRSAGPGHLPCPDKNGNGSPSLGCGGLAIGFLPVDFGTGENKNISFLQQQALSSEPIWYVVSSAFRNNPAPTGSPSHKNIVNSDTRGELVLDGEPEIIALLIAPGPALAGQHRAGSVDVADYLEGANADGDVEFGSGQGNDLILAIRWQDLMPLVERRVLSAAREVVKNYQTENGYLPWLAKVEQPMLQGDSVCTPCQWQGFLATERYYSSRAWPVFSEQSCVDESTSLEVQQVAPVLPIWFASNYWHRFVWLHLQADERDGTCVTDTAPIYDGESVSALVVTVGEALLEPTHADGPQLREGVAELKNYLDDGEWLDQDSAYPILQDSEGINDQWSVLP